jgi:carboxymethylenebutenolidase
VAGMGEIVKFTSNGDEAQGYLSVAASGSGPGVMVLQEWWGLVPQIKRCCDRLSSEGFTTLAPDLYRGEIAEHSEMDKASELMNALPHDRAARDMAGAIDFLLSNSATDGDKVGVVGFCMGGLLALTIAAQQGDRMGAAVAFYGAPYGDSAPDWSGLKAPVLVHIAESDDFFPPDALVPLCESLSATGKDVSYHVYEGTGHAFANEENALGTHDEEAAATAWDRTINFLRSNLG